jgi:hypothetical protein
MVEVVGQRRLNVGQRDARKQIHDILSNKRCSSTSSRGVESHAPPTKGARGTFWSTGHAQPCSAACRRTSVRSGPWAKIWLRSSFQAIHCPASSAGTGRPRSGNRAVNSSSVICMTVTPFCEDTPIVRRLRVGSQGHRGFLLYPRPGTVIRASQEHGNNEVDRYARQRGRQAPKAVMVTVRHGPAYAGRARAVPVGQPHCAARKPAPRVAIPIRRCGRPQADVSGGGALPGGCEAADSRPPARTRPPGLSSPVADLEPGSACLPDLLRKMAVPLRGGLDERKIAGIFADEKPAKELAERLLRAIRQQWSRVPRLFPRVVRAGRAADVRRSGELTPRRASRLLLGTGTPFSAAVSGFDLRSAPSGSDHRTGGGFLRHLELPVGRPSRGGRFVLCEHRG